VEIKGSVPGDGGGSVGGQILVVRPADSGRGIGRFLLDWAGRRSITTGSSADRRGTLG
jgi:hypothetical protein